MMPAPLQVNLPMTCNMVPNPKSPLQSYISTWMRPEAGRSIPASFPGRDWGHPPRVGVIGGEGSPCTPVWQLQPRVMLGAVGALGNAGILAARERCGRSDGG